MCDHGNTKLMTNGKCSVTYANVASSVVNYIQVHDCTYKMGVVSGVGVASEGGEVTREEEEYCRLAIQ